jgi:Helix-turn-helix domain
MYENLIPGDELARRLGVSKKTVERWTYRRIIPSYNFSPRCLRFDPGEVRQALRKFERPALRRLSRGTYRPKPRAPVARYEAQQMEMRFAPEDSSQLILPLALTPSPDTGTPSD